MKKTLKPSLDADTTSVPEAIVWSKLLQSWIKIGNQLLGQMHSRIECADRLAELLQSELELGERCLEIASAFETPEDFECDIRPHLAELREIVAILIKSLKEFDDPKAKVLASRLRKQVMVGSDL